MTAPWFKARQIVGYGSEGGVPNQNYPTPNAKDPEFIVNQDWTGYPLCCQPEDQYGNYQCEGGGLTSNGAGIYLSAITDNPGNYLAGGTGAACNWASQGWYRSRTVVVLIVVVVVVVVVVRERLVVVVVVVVVRERVVVVVVIVTAVV